MGAKSVVWLSIAAALVASCATTPPADDVAYLDERALRSCLGPAIPVELMRDPLRVKGSVLMELYVRPSGRIYYASIISGSGNARLDNYLAWRLAGLRCSPFLSAESNEPYWVELELSIETDQ